MEKNDDYTTKLNEKHTKIIKDLQELQAVETYLFTKIQEAASSNKGKDEQKKISNHIEKLSQTRATLLTELKNLYTSSNDDVNSANAILGNQTVMAQQLKKETDKAQQEEKRLIAEKNNKQRLAQIGEYEYAKNTEHKSILKVIVYGSFFVLLIIFLNAKEILPLFLTKIFTVIICFIVLLHIIKKMFWNFKRDNIDYSKFIFPKKNDVVDKVTENTFNINDLLGVECKDTTLDSEEILQPTATDATTDATTGATTGTPDATTGTPTEGFALLNTSSCKSCKNIFPSNNLNNSTFKNTSLKYSTVN
jgi:hypothetical protein